MREAGVGEDLAMLIDAEHKQAGAIDSSLKKPRDGRVSPFVDLSDQDQLAAGLADAENLAHVAWKVRPPEMRLYGGDEVERAFGEWQLRDGTVSNFNAALRDRRRISLSGPRQPR